jgi:hypothetical protein
MRENIYRHRFLPEKYIILITLSQLPPADLEEGTAPLFLLVLWRISTSETLLSPLSLLPPVGSCVGEVFYKASSCLMIYQFRS